MLTPWAQKPRGGDEKCRMRLSVVLLTRLHSHAGQDEYLTEMLDSFLEEAPKAAASRARRIEEVCKSKMSGSTLMLDVVHKRSVKREKQIDGLIEKVMLHLNLSTCTVMMSQRRCTADMGGTRRSSNG